jgi:flagellar hook-associated protein 2
VSITSIDGLISGLNTTQIVTQLMQVEARPQTSLKNNLQTQQSVTASYRSINATLAALQTAATALTGTPAWEAVSASSSSDAVTATATAGTAVGNLTFNVTSLAKPHVVTSLVATEQPATTGFGVLVYIGDGPATHLDVATDDAQGVADAVNAAKLGIRATVLTTDQGTVLQFAATKSGAAASFDIGGLTGATKVLSQGTDAMITVGDPIDGGYTVSSATNTITGVPPGVTLTAIRKQDNVTVSVVADAASIADRMQAMVTAANAALTEIGTATARQQAGKPAAPLTGDLHARQIQQRLLSSVSNGMPDSDYGAFSKVGVQLDRSGALTFDRAAFLAAYTADPAGTRTAVSTGLAAALQTVTKEATDPISGSLTLSVRGGEASARRLTDEITGWDTRLATRKVALQRQYAHLETVLGRLKDQSTWLAGQLSALSNNSG